MKQVSTILTAVLFISLSSFTTPGNVTKATPVLKASVSGTFNFFRIHRQAKDGVTATWSFASASNTIGYRLERTYGDPADPYTLWDVISDIQHSDNRSFKFTDRPVEPGFISYRVVAVSSNGDDVVSEILTQHIVSH